MLRAYSTLNTEYRTLDTGDDVKPTIMAEEAKGNDFLGYSNWNGQQVSKFAVIRYGKKIGATLVLYSSKYTDTVNAGAIGTSTVSRYSAFAMAIPININRLDQIALYFRQAPRKGIGIAMDVITAAKRQGLGTNMGIKVGSIVPGSPAFLDDILTGDIIMSYGGQPVYDGPSLKAAILAGYGKEVKIVINRNGSEIDKTLKTAPDGVW